MNIDIQKIREEAYLKIQGSPSLWKEWNNCKTEEEQELMITTVVYEMGFDDGVEYVLQFT